MPTKMIYGPGCVASLPDELCELNAKRVLLVTDKGIVKAGICGIVEKLLSDAGIPFSIFDSVEANPKDVNVSAGAKAAVDFNADTIVALGGGSPIDCAKAIGVLVTNGGDDIKKYEGKTAIKKHPLPLLTIPTTSGTGSEVTFSSVITDTKNHYKMTIKSAHTAAKTAILDPELTLSVPAPVTAATGIDALTHAIEAYTATCAEPISDAVALYAIELIYGNLVSAVKNGKDLTARSNMLIGSLLAGIAFSHSDVASVHCLAESLGSIYDAPHGTCNAILLPYVMDYSKDYCMERYARIAGIMGAKFKTNEEGAHKAVELVKKLTVDVSLPSFKSLNVKKSDFALIAEMSARNISTESNPRKMCKEDYMAVLEMAYNG